MGYFIENEDYNLFKIDEALYKYELSGLQCTREKEGMECLILTLMVTVLWIR